MTYKKNYSCPQCKSTDTSQLTNNCYFCNNCKSNFYIDSNQQSLNIVSNSNFKQPLKTKSKKSLFASKGVWMGVICFVLIKGLVIWHDYDKKQKATTEMANALKDKVFNVEANHRYEFDAESQTIVDVTAKNAVGESYARTAFILYKETENGQNHLFKATYLTKDKTEDSKAIRVKKENNKLVAIDKSTGEKIINFKEIPVANLSSKAVILYSDKNNILIKNSNANDVLLQLIDPWKGKIVWTISDKEIPEIDTLQGLYSPKTNLGVTLSDDDFQINIPPNYYIITKQGYIDKFGLLNE
ncbi:hypothetical protein RCS94_05545 [Orbaceae bacterium ac157xtp]